MPVIARTRFLVGRIWCDVRTYQVYGRGGDVAARFSLASIEGRDVASASRVIDAIRAVRRIAEARQVETAGRSNTGRCLMGENSGLSEGQR